MIQAASFTLPLCSDTLPCGPLRPSRSDTLPSHPAPTNPRPALHPIPSGNPPSHLPHPPPVWHPPFPSGHPHPFGPPSSGPSRRPRLALPSPPLPVWPPHPFRPPHPPPIPSHHTSGHCPTARVVTRTFSDGRTDDRTMAARASVTWTHCSVLFEVTWGKTARSARTRTCVRADGQRPGHGCQGTI
jgi:hypothetical protein